MTSFLFDPFDIRQQNRVCKKDEILWRERNSRQNGSNQTSFQSPADGRQQDHVRAIFRPGFAAGKATQDRDQIA